MLQTTDSHLGQLLVERGRLDPDMLETAVREAQQGNEGLEKVLVRMGLCEEEEVLQAVAEVLHLEYRRLGDVKPTEELLRLITPEVAKHYRIIPVELKDGVLHIATSDPHDMYMVDELRRQLHVDIELVVASNAEIDKAYNLNYGLAAEVISRMTGEVNTVGVADTAISLTDDFDIGENDEDATIVSFVNQIIQEAMRDRATDIHVEPMEKELRIRYRIDGMLYEAPIPAAIKRFQAAIISRLKIMADLNIAERRLPQDGKIKLRHNDREFDLRVATVPTPYGEAIALRILSRNSTLSTLDRLGFMEAHKATLRQMIAKPYGIVFVTGPTGSGKSTTLYAALSEINHVDRKILTIEDPIEYRIPGVTQIQVNPGIDLTFARVLRSTLRMDPDVIMVGETRDPETAKITIATAMTGHLVFSTLHTNDACGAFSRLGDMGVEPYLIASSVEGVIAQRLVRLLCNNCKASFIPDPALVRTLNMTREDPGMIDFKKHVGCEACRYTGFAGRTVIVEMVKMNETTRRKIVADAPASEIKRAAMQDGMLPIRYNGWQKIKLGVTTPDEVIRVTMEDEFNSDGGGFTLQLTKEQLAEIEAESQAD